MASDTLHAPRERLSQETLSLHHAIVSLMEEMEAATGIDSGLMIVRMTL